ncbi:TPA: hypothetical protein HA251_06535 [Candidatus Woesearchaeota archaeon]|nr:hypothetical protein [Candidatus Woesearchaeota archaeon]
MVTTTMKRAIIIYGPSGAGKSTLAGKISGEYGYKHCDADAFKLMFSPTRSRERSEIGEKICFHYTKEMIDRGYDIIIEAMPEKMLSSLKRSLKQKKYKIIELSLIASLHRCIKNDAMRTKKHHGEKVITEVYERLVYRRGHVIDVDNKTPAQVFRSIKKSGILGRV